jgi:cardiolipin synthase
MSAASSGRATSPFIAWLPNLLCLARLASVPVVIWAILERNFGLAFWLFFAAGVSDALDGFIAKRFNAESVFGAFLDPIADKCLLVGVYVAFAARDMLPLWLIMLIVFRDLLIVGGALVVHAVTHRLSMEPLLISKANTLLQIALAAFVLANAAFRLGLQIAIDVGCVVVATTTFLSGLAYVVVWTRRIAEWERGK